MYHVLYDSCHTWLLTRLYTASILPSLSTTVVMACWFKYDIHRELRSRPGFPS